MSIRSLLKAELGQVTVEFAIGGFLAVLLIGSSGALLYAEWKRELCAYLVFENTHARLTGSPRTLWAGTLVHLLDTGSSVQGQARCAQARETVTLPKLEYARW